MSGLLVVFAQLCHGIIIHSSQKAKNNPNISERWKVKKMGGLDTVDYYSALNGKVILTGAAMWKNMEDIMQS